eukprot:Colp12_sorted_trinity150504_noHs@21802
MSTFTDAKKKWADADSDSSDSEEETEVEQPKVEEPVVEAVADESSDSESESDNDDTEPLNLAKATITAAPVKKVDVKSLSKKEQKELKQKELDDLDSILAGFAPETPVSVVESSTPASVPANVEVGDADKKKKKKKKATGTKAEAAPVEAAKDEEVVVVKDINAVLKNRTKKGPAKSPVVSDAQRIALAEAKAVANDSKKKRDKSKFCEGTY